MGTSLSCTAPRKRPPGAEVADAGFFRIPRWLSSIWSAEPSDVHICFPEAPSRAPAPGHYWAWGTSQWQEVPYKQREPETRTWSVSPQSSYTPFRYTTAKQAAASLQGRIRPDASEPPPSAVEGLTPASAASAATPVAHQEFWEDIESGGNSSARKAVLMPSADKSVRVFSVAARQTRRSTPLQTITNGIALPRSAMKKLGAPHITPGRIRFAELL